MGVLPQKDPPTRSPPPSRGQRRRLQEHPPPPGGRLGVAALLRRAGGRPPSGRSPPATSRPRRSAAEYAGLKAQWQQSPQAEQAFRQLEFARPEPNIVPPGRECGYPPGRPSGRDRPERSTPEAGARRRPRRADGLDQEKRVEADGASGEAQSRASARLGKEMKSQLGTTARWRRLRARGPGQEETVSRAVAPRGGPPGAQAPSSTPAKEWAKDGPGIFPGRLGAHRWAAEQSWGYARVAKAAGSRAK